MTRMAISPSRRLTGNKSAAQILGIGTATPPSAPQEQAMEFAMTLTGQPLDQQAWLKRVYRQTGIQSRGSVLVREGDHSYAEPRKFYPPSKGPDDRGPTTAARMAVYAERAPKLALESARRALENSDTSPASITHLITASCTGFYAPGVDAALIEHLGLSRSVRRVHVGFMGCHAAFNALAAAQDSAATRNARILVTCVELCSLNWAYGSDPGKLIANALFADGSASAVVGTSALSPSPGNPGEGRGGGREPINSDLAEELVRPISLSPQTTWQLTDFSSYLIPNSHDAMTWNLGDHGFEMTLSPGVPEHIRTHLRPWCEQWLAKNELKLSDVAGWAIHPGGPKILAAVAEALELEADALRFSHKVLAAHGNMSSATILFILKEMAKEIAGPVVAIGLGPGLMAEGMLLRR
jgi:prepilin-type processing-associated H-X9-DG protein